MTANLAAFNFQVTAHLIIGSWHEESRLREAYGQAYVDYQMSGINLFVRKLPPGSSKLALKPLFQLEVDVFAGHAARPYFS